MSSFAAAYAREAVRSTNDQLEDVYETCEGLQPRDVDKWRREYQRNTAALEEMTTDILTSPVKSMMNVPLTREASRNRARTRETGAQMRTSSDLVREGRGHPQRASDPPPSWSLRTTLKDMAHEPLRREIELMKTKESLVFDEIRRVEEAASAAGPAPHAPQPPAPQAPVGGHAQVQRSWLAFLARTDIGCPCRPPSAQQRQRRKLVPRLPPKHRDVDSCRMYRDWDWDGGGLTVVSTLQLHFSDE
ncbi:hypothetical protein C8R47DRAFT_1231243 [Mycena vitilis]|nr:hypothetical protein C8R47DRAFT_1231243 [Mycena vitilis]